MVDAVHTLQGKVVGVGVLSNRGGVTAEQLGVPRLHELTTIPMEFWALEECPLCKDGTPVNTQIGKGAEFLASRFPSS